MQYALLIYSPDDHVADQARRPINPDITAILARPDVGTAVVRTGKVGCRV